MSAMKDLATPVLTLTHDEHQALIAVVSYLMENESHSCEEFVANGGDIKDHIYHKAVILENVLRKE